MAQCIATHFLNPNTKTPITVGITGGCSEGVTSLMDKIKEHLLLTAAQAVFPEESFNQDHKDISEKGEGIRNEDIINEKGEGIRKEDISEMGTGIRKGVHKYLLADKRNPGKDQKTSLVNFLEKFQQEHEPDYKSLACVELKQLLNPPKDERVEKIARVLTVNFSARKYKGTLEACDGLAVEITREIEESLTRAQRWSTFWRHPRRENSQSSYSLFDLFCLAMAFVVVWISSAFWMFLDGVNLTDLKTLKYGSIPATLMAISVPALKLSLKFFKLKPVSHYLSLRFSSENSGQYGQQQKVISDIKFLKKEIGEKPYPIFSFLAGEKFKFWQKIKDIPVPKFGSAPEDRLRIIVFLNDLDEYVDTVMLRESFLY